MQFYFLSYICVFVSVRNVQMRAGEHKRKLGPLELELQEVVGAGN